MQPGTGSVDQDARPSPSFVEAARRAQIVDAAIAVIAEEGYPRASFARIAGRAGVSPSLISYHFADKAELLATVSRTVLGALDDALNLEVAGARSYSAALRALVEAQVRWFAAHPREILVLARIEDAGRSPASPPAPSRQHDDSLAELEAFLAAGQAEGSFRPFPVRTVALSLLATLETIPHELARDADLDVDELGRSLADLFDRATRAGRRRRS